MEPDLEPLPIAVVVITKDAEVTIEECLRAVQRNRPAEIIVVDGLSSDGTVAIARRYTERIYCDGGQGKGPARQLGAEVAGQEYIAYVDADVVLTEGVLATMLAQLQASDYVGISAVEPPGIGGSTYWDWAQHQHAQIAHPEGRPAGIGMAACLLRRQTILKYGFERSYGGYLDDQDLEIRLRRDGHTFGRSSAQIYHYSKADLKSFVRYRFLLGRVSTYYMRKYGPWHIRFWPPLTALYWLGLALLRGRLKLIPYYVVDGVVETAGMVQGFLELMAEAVGRRGRGERRPPHPG